MKLGCVQDNPSFQLYITVSLKVISEDIHLIMHISYTIRFLCFKCKNQSVG